MQDKARANLLEEFNDKIYYLKSPVKARLQPGKETFELIDRYNTIYEEIIDLQNDALSNEFKNLITVMKIGMRSDDWIPPIMHYYLKFGPNKIDTFLKRLEYKFTGDWVCGITPTSRLEAMNSILKAIDNTHASNINKLLDNKKLFKINEADFRGYIQGNVYGKQYCRYLLLKIECVFSAIIRSIYPVISTLQLSMFSHKIQKQKVSGG